VNGAAGAQRRAQNCFYATRRRAAEGRVNVGSPTTAGPIASIASTIAARPIASTRSVAARPVGIRTIPTGPIGAGTVATWPVGTRAVATWPVDARPVATWPLDARAVNSRSAPAVPSDRTTPAHAAAPAIAAPVPAGTAPSGVVPAVPSAAEYELNLIDSRDLIRGDAQSSRRDRGSLRAAADHRSGQREQRRGQQHDYFFHRLLPDWDAGKDTTKQHECAMQVSNWGSRPAQCPLTDLRSALRSVLPGRGGIACSLSQTRELRVTDFFGAYLERIGLIARNHRFSEQIRAGAGRTSSATSSAANSRARRNNVRRHKPAALNSEA
jgi:hypothetical protein